MSITQIDLVKLYLLCFNAKKVATRVKQDGVYEISKAVKEYFPYKEILYEIPVGNHVCALAIISDHTVIAIEVKSSRDNVVRSIAQTKHYKKWANKVYLVYDEKHRNKVKGLKQLSREIGLFEFMDGQIKKVREAISNSISTISLLTLMTHRFLRHVAKKFKVTTRGTKKEIAEHLSKKISEEQAVYLFQQFLRMRAAYREKVSKPSVENARIYPLTLYSKER